MTWSYPAVSIRAQLIKEKGNGSIQKSSENVASRKANNEEVAVAAILGKPQHSRSSSFPPSSHGFQGPLLCCNAPLPEAQADYSVRFL